MYLIIIDALVNVGSYRYESSGRHGESAYPAVRPNRSVNLTR